jgi:hypothetical protein
MSIEEVLSLIGPRGRSYDKKVSIIFTLWSWLCYVCPHFQQLHSFCTINSFWMMTLLKANYPCLLQLWSHEMGELCSSLVGGVVQRSFVHSMPKAAPLWSKDFLAILVGLSTLNFPTLLVSMPTTKFPPAWWVYQS